jgi:hypothetical protein
MMEMPARSSPTSTKRNKLILCVPSISLGVVNVDVAAISS